MLKVAGDRAEIVADSGANPFKIVPIHESLAPLQSTNELDGLRNRPEGAFVGRWQADANVPFLTANNDDGAYTPLNVVVRRYRVSRDTTEFPAVGYNRGVLPAGPRPDGLWEGDANRGAVEFRIPWMLLNITDPSSRHLLNDADHPLGPYRSVPIPGIRVAAALRAGTKWSTLPRPGGTVAAFTWDRWERPQWRARPKPLYRAMQRVFRNLRAPVTGIGH